MAKAGTKTSTVKRPPELGRPVRNDAESESILYQGASINQLVRLFGMDAKKIRAKLHGLPHIAVRAASPVYNVREAAQRLVQPDIPIEEWIAAMNHADLPMLLRKEYWAGMRSRQIYEIAARDLWPTPDVEAAISEIFKCVSMTLRLAGDTVEREVGLDERQREVITRLIDETLNNTYNIIKSHMEAKVAEKKVPPEVDESNEEL